VFQALKVEVLLGQAPAIAQPVVPDLVPIGDPEVVAKLAVGNVIA